MGNAGAIGSCLLPRQWERGEIADIASMVGMDNGDDQLLVTFPQLVHLLGDNSKLAAERYQRGQQHEQYQYHRFPLGWRLGTF